MCSCSTIREDFSDCPRFFLKYDYYLENDKFTEADFVEAIDFVEIYIFDTQLKFITSIKIDDKQMIGGKYINVPAYYIGKTMVAYAREMRGSYDIPVLNVGDHIDLLTVQLRTKVNEKGENVSDLELADLFYGGREVMTFQDGDGRTQIVNFTRNDKKVNISLSDLVEGDVSKYEVKITAKNGLYSSDNSIMSNSPKITYMLYNSEESRTGDLVDEAVERFHTLRLKKRYESDVKLTIQNKESGEFILFGEDKELLLVKYLLKSKPLHMNDQEYLDRAYMWDISISLKSDLALSITVNDWITWFNNSDL